MQINIEQMGMDIRSFIRQLKIERNLSEHTLRAYECDWRCMHAYSAESAHPFRRNGAPFRFKLSSTQLIN